MTEDLDFEARLESRLRARASLAARPFNAAAIARHALAPNLGTGSIARRWLTIPRGLRWSVVALALAASLLAALAIGARLLEVVVPPMTVGNGWVVFTVTDVDRAGRSDVHIVRPGVPERALTLVDSVRERCPQFSPDGTRIAYLSEPADRQGPDEIRIVSIDLNGVVGTPQVLVGGRGDLSCPAWSPDSQSVASMAGRTLLVQGLDGSSIATDAGAPAGEPGAFDWSPDGTEIAYVGPSSLWIIPIAGGEARRIYEADPGVELDSPQWSPDGTRIAIAARRVVEPLPTRVVSVNGSASPQILPTDAPVHWSPSGDLLATVRTTKRGDTDWNEVVTMAPDGSNERVIADAFKPIRGVAWSPDGEQLLYIVDDFGQSPGLLASPASGDGAPLVLLTRPHWLEYTTSEDLSWQPVFSR